MSEAAVALPQLRSAVRLGLTVRSLTASLLTLFAADNLLLLHFWGLSIAATAGLIFVAAAAIWLLCRKIPSDLPDVSLQTFAVAVGISLMLFALGGEGRFFYANTDWQVRDAVLRDMATNPWPFAYDLHGTAYFLRAPIGIYLLPAMFGGNADLALLLSDALRFALLLTLGWHLFASKRERAIVLATFILFSGWDAVGTALYASLGAHLPWDHLEPWNFGYEYSSNVTQAFWAAPHALAGWTCALTFLLWRKALVPVGVFAASIPLVAIWSPLAIIGAIPFAAFAGITVLRGGRLDLGDIGFTLLALAVSLPALLYLQIDAASVGMHLLHTNPLIWLACILLEVLPFTVPLLRQQERAAADKPVVRLVQFVLLAMPVIQVGSLGDFQMRASVMPLALLAILFAQWICRTLDERPIRTVAMGYALVAVALGTVTPLLEVRRAAISGASPRPLCSLIGVWKKQDILLVPYATYLAPLSKLPASLQDVPVTAGKSDPVKCWDRPWVLPAGWARRSTD